MIGLESWTWSCTTYKLVVVLLSGLESWPSAYLSSLSLSSNEDCYEPKPIKKHNTYATTHHVVVVTQVGETKLSCVHDVDAF